jgi:hypothetical protein
MAKYSIEEKTLTDIGDALRRKHGETRIEIGEEITKVSKTSNATGFDSFEGEYDDNKMQEIYHVVKIEGAENLYVKMSYQTINRSSAYVQVAAGDLVGNFPHASATKYGGKTLSTVDLVFENTDVVTFKFYSYAVNKSYLGYYAEVTGQPKEEVKNTYNPLDMAGAIDSIIPIDESKIPTDEELTITGDCNYRFANGGWDWFVEKYGDRMTTKDIKSMTNMFVYTDLTNIPFEINCKKDATYIDATYMFSSCKNLLSIPKINNCKVSGMNSIFQGSYTIRHIPEDIDTWFDWSYMESQTSAYSCSRANTFYGCTSLRSIPMEFLSHGNPNSSYSYSVYNSCFSNCYVLDEIVGLPFPHLKATWTSNAFNNAFNNCSRLKDLTFAVQEDGTPYTVKWKSQTISLNIYIGYLSTSDKYKITQYNSGITADKEVTDDVSYQALKNDPDWFTTKEEYSRYNHDSAVATINSLPDSSAYGTNTIKFKGAAGSATDGGAINTLTEAEIAVAAAKGWTVTLV